MALRFSEFVLDEGQRQLLRSGAPVHLEPKAFDLLALLARHRPRALARQQIHDAIWPETFVSESSIAGLVLDLRVALGDEQARPQFIRTVRGYGYAFCATVLDDEPASSAPPRWAALWGVSEVALPEGTHFIGRGEGCLIRLSSVRVSRRHARIMVAPDGISIEDLDSRNGTWVGGERIAGRVPLQDRAEVCVGGETVLVLAAGPEVSTLTDGAARPKA